MYQFAYDFSAGIPLNLLIIYGKDPNLKAGLTLHNFCRAIYQ